MRASAFRVLVVSLLACLGTVPSAQSQLTNPGFENWSDNGPSGPPDDWAVQPATDLTGGQESAIVYSGTFSTNLTWTTQATTYFEQVVMGVIPGSSYDLNIRAYDNDPAGRCRIYGHFQTSAGTITGDVVSSTYTIDAGAWQAVSAVDAVAPADAARFAYRIACYDESSSWDGDATVYVDDAVFLGPIDPAIFADDFETGETSLWSLTV